MHGDVTTWVRLRDDEKASRDNFILNKVWIALDFKENLGLGYILWGNVRLCLETKEQVHLNAGAERLVKSDVEGTLVLC